MRIFAFESSEIAIDGRAALSASFLDVLSDTSDNPEI